MPHLRRLITNVRLLRSIKGTPADWRGIVASVNRKVSETAGEFRSPAQPQAENDFGYRVQVRVVGEHPPEKSVLPDEELPFAIVTNSVTGGSGTETPQIRAGDTVGGYIANDNYYLHGLAIDRKIELLYRQPFNNGFAPFLEQLPQVPSYSNSMVRRSQIYGMQTSFFQ